MKTWVDQQPYCHKQEVFQETGRPSVQTKAYSQRWTVGSIKKGVKTIVFIMKSET